MTSVPVYMAVAPEFVLARAWSSALHVGDAPAGDEAAGEAAAGGTSARYSPAGCATAGGATAGGATAGGGLTAQGETTAGLFARLSATLLAVLREPDFRPERAAAVGEALATGCATGGPEVLGKTLRVLSLELPVLLGRAAPADLPGRLAAVLEALATGYVRAVQHDPLTRLPNRAVLFSRLTAALAGGVPVGVIYLDLDGFKAINDSRGHDTGDQLLTAIADRIGAAAQARGALAARIGGDEFVLLAERPAGTGWLISLATETLAAVAEPVLTGGGNVSVTACAGIATVNGQTTPASISGKAAGVVANADAALYMAKSAGPGQWAVHEPGTGPVAAKQQTSFASSLRTGLDRGEFRLAYLPILRLCDGQLLGFQVVPSWNHPAFGELTADVFVPLAEASDAAPQLNSWLITAACADASGWRLPATGTAAVVAIRVPPAELLRPGLADTVSAILASASISPAALQLEFAEHVLATAPGHATDELLRLAEAGVRIAVRGFGASSAGFRYLRKVPASGVVLDQDLTAELDEPVISALTSLAHARGLSVTAPVAADRELAGSLAALGCDNAFAPVLGGALPARQVEAMLRAAA